ncbi:MAG: hypothetical protein JRJ85_22620 [Deltaproteobacteria bacterium]|nr:hypothetical protein [Deltaproteobacteria bacterium]
MHAGAVADCLCGGRMCLISNIVPVENVRMPGGKDGARRSWLWIRLIRTTSMTRSGEGARRILDIGKSTERRIPPTRRGIVTCKWSATRGGLEPGQMPDR